MHNLHTNKETNAYLGYTPTINYKNTNIQRAHLAIHCNSFSRVIYNFQRKHLRHTGRMEIAKENIIYGNLHDPKISIEWNIQSGSNRFTLFEYIMHIRVSCLMRHRHKEFLQLRGCTVEYLLVERHKCVPQLWKF